MALEDKYDDIKKLIDVGKEKGYLTYNEVNDLIPHDMHSPDDIEDLLTTIGTQGIDVLEGPKMPGDKKFDADIEAGEDVELDLSPGTLEKTNDPVRMYLREMGTVPLLTREGEVEIAKRIERGQLRVLKALSRSPIVIREIIAIGEDLKRGVRSIKEIVLFDEEEITEEVVVNRLQDITGRIDELQKPLQEIDPAFREAGRDSAEEASPRLSPLPLGAGPRADHGLAGHPQAGLHQRRAQAPDRSRQQDGRQHARARQAGRQLREARRRHPLGRAEEGVPQASRARSAPTWSAWSTTPAPTFPS